MSVYHNLLADCTLLDVFLDIRGDTMLPVSALDSIQDMILSEMSALRIIVISAENLLTNYGYIWHKYIILEPDKSIFRL
jgi:hypothetical protein